MEIFYNSSMLVIGFIAGVVLPLILVGELVRRTARHVDMAKKEMDKACKMYDNATKLYERISAKTDENTATILEFRDQL